MKNKKYNKKEFIKIDTQPKIENKLNDNKKEQFKNKSFKQETNKVNLSREELIQKNRHLFLKEDKFSSFTENSTTEIEVNDIEANKENAKKSDLFKEIKINTKL